MQFRNFFLFLSLWSIFLIILPQSADAQQITQNKHGERIIIFKNGNWEYYDEKKPLHRVVLKEHLRLNGADESFENSKGSQDAALLKFESMVETAEEALALAEEKESDAKFSKLLLEEEIEESKNNEEVSEEKYDKLKYQLKLASQLEKLAKKARKKAEKNLKKIKKNKGKYLGDSTKVARNKKKKKNKKEVNSEDIFREDATFFSASKKFKKYDMKKDVMYNPPPVDCVLSFDGIDEFIGKRRKDVARTVLFTYTDDNMRRYMEEDDYIVCEGNLTRVEGGVLLLNLFFTIKTNDAKRAFGELEKNSTITIKMIDGSKISLANNSSDSGVFNSLEQKHVYTGQYVISSGQEKKLKKGEVDLVRVIWETGFEDYEVYNLDFFRDQFRCLNK